MPTALTILLIGVCLLASTACSTLQGTRYHLDQATITNATNGTLHDVKVLQQPTNTVGATNALLPNRSFNVGFKGTDMMADHSIITWTDDSGNFHRQQIKLPQNEENDRQAKNLTFTIYPDDTVTIRLNPSE